MISRRISPMMRTSLPTVNVGAGTPMEDAILLMTVCTVVPGAGGETTLSSGVSQTAATVSRSTPQPVLVAVASVGGLKLSPAIAMTQPGCVPGLPGSGII